MALPLAGIDRKAPIAGTAHQVSLVAKLQTVQFENGIPLIQALDALGRQIGPAASISRIGMSTAMAFTPGRWTTGVRAGECWVS